MSGILWVVSRRRVESLKGREWMEGRRGVEVEVGGDGGGARRSGQRKLGGRRAGVPVLGCWSLTTGGSVTKRTGAFQRPTLDSMFMAAMIHAWS